MKTNAISTRTTRKAKTAPAGKASEGRRPQDMGPDGLNAIFAGAGQKLREGKSTEAERMLTEAIQGTEHSENDLANLRRLQSFALETVGRYQEALDTLKMYEDETGLEHLTHETQIRVITQLAISYNNLGDHPKAVTLLKETYERAKNEDYAHLIGSIETGLARVYRKLNESPISRDHAERALTFMRERGDWLGMAEAYREIALSYHQEGNSERSLEYFTLGIQIIGDRSAPFMLGKLYTDMSGAYSFLRKPHEGIECLERSIEFFSQTEHVLNSVIAYNNLGIHLLHIGEWDRAEQMIKQALALAERSNHVHVAGILDSLGEVKLLRGDLDEAGELLERAVAFARGRKHQWYEAQAMRNQARLKMAKGDLTGAADDARTTIELGRQIGDRHYANMAGLVLAESSLLMGRPADCDSALVIVEENDPQADFYVTGSIQRIRGLMALKAGDKELAVHHFNRCLTIFEAAEDIFHTATANLLLGRHLSSSRNSRAMKHLAAALEIFRRLGTPLLVEEANDEIAKRRSIAATERSEIAPGQSSSAASQLLMVRLAEATASRELLFRELVAVLQQESQAKKILIAERDETKQLVPFITHGYSITERAELLGKLQAASDGGDSKAFARNRNIAVLTLKPTNAEPATLIIHPNSGAALNDGSSLQPLLRVVELGMDVVALRDRSRTQPIEQEANPYTSNGMMPGFIHSSPAMTSLVEEIYKIRSSDVTVLVTGESGTGKELVSRAIHTLSNRKDKIFIPFNCTAVPKELAEGHLFGYRKGSFTGAVTDSPGMIRAADGGTLFLDEVGDLPLDVQPKLLRFLQEGEVQPIGEKRPIKVDVRVIAATNMPLEDKVADGSFREDLFYRLNVIRLRVPPLRERRSEIPPIINYYIDQYSQRFGKRDISFTPQTVDLLMVCEWEGNVRQLCNEVQRIIARAVDGEIITPEDLSPELKRSARPLTPFGGSTGSKVIASFDGPVVPFAGIAENATLEEAVTLLEIQMIRSSLTRNNWNISRVANELGLTRRGLYMKISRFGIERSA